MMSAKTRTFSIFDGRIHITVVVGKTDDCFETGPSCPPYKERKIKESYEGAVFVSKPGKGATGERYPFVVFNISHAEKDGIREEVLLHECFHLFFVLLNLIKQHPRKMMDIASDELYARNFTYLVDNVRKISDDLFAEYKAEEKALFQKLLSQPAPSENGNQRT